MFYKRFGVTFSLRPRLGAYRYKKFELMLTRRTKAYSSFGSVV